MTKQILLVEDDTLLNTTLKLNLYKAGYEVIPVINGDQAKELIDVREFDLLLTDLSLEGAQGMELVRSAREKYPELPIIILTGTGNMGKTIDALRLHVDDFLEKPCRVEKVIEAVEKCFAESNSEPLKNALEKKSEEIREIHHRIRNNFMLLSSLINLESMQLENEEMNQLLHRIKHRIAALSLVHEKLFESDNFTVLNFKDYLQDLRITILTGYTLENFDVDIDMEYVDDIFTPRDAVISLGLISVELLDTRLQGGFEGMNEGKISFTFGLNSHGYSFSYSDSGQTAADDAAWRHTHSLPAMLLDALTEQLGGESSISFDKEEEAGFRFSLSFPVSE